MLDYQARSWVRLFLSVKGTVVPRIMPRLLLIGALTLALAIVEHFYHLHQFDKIPHQLLGLVLGFLVVLRTNTAYDRFWEGRKLWGGIVNSSRNLIRLAITYGGDARPLADLVTAYVLAVKVRLRQGTNLAEVQAWVAPPLYQQLQKVSNPPLVLSYELGRWVRDQVQAGKIDSILAQHLDERIRELVDHQGGCERILRTPIPFNYAVHIKQFMLLYLVSLPFSLVPSIGFLAIPVVLLIAFGLIGIEEAGVEVEDPFGYDPNDLPLEAICSGIERDVMTLARLQDSEPQA